MEKKVNWTGWLGLIVALGSLVFGYYSFNTQNEFARQTEISARQPLLNIELLKADSNEKYGFLLKNLGAGTAIIEDFKVYTNRENFVNDVSRPYWLDDGTFWFDTFFTYEDINVLVKGYGIPTVDRGNVFLLATRALNYEQIRNDKVKFSDRKSFYNSEDVNALDDVIIEITYRSSSPLDEQIYVLTFSESFEINNIRGSIKNKNGIKYEPHKKN